MRVSHALQLLNKLRRNSVNAKRDQLLEIDVIVAALLEFRHPLWRRAVDSHGNQRILIRGIPTLMQAADHLWAHAVNAESDQFIGV